MNKKFVLLLIVAFFIGMSGLVAEYLIATTNSYLLGNSLEQFAITIGLMLLTMGAGAFLSKSIQRDLVMWFVVIESLLALLIGTSSYVSYMSFAYMQNHFDLIQYATIGMIGLLIGYEIPLITRIVEEQNIALDRNVSRVFTFDYLGCGFGAWIWVHYILGRMNLMHVAIVLALINLVIAMVVAVVFAHRKHIFIFAATLSITTFVLSWSAIKGDGWIAVAEQRLYDDPIIVSKTTPYQRIVLTYSSQPNEYRLYLNGSTQFSSLDESIYHENLVHPAMIITPNPKNVLILGGGDGCALREIKKYPSVEKIVLVDLDSGMTNLAKHNPVMRSINNNAFDDQRVSVRELSIIPTGNKTPVIMEEEVVQHQRHYKPKKVTVAQTFVFNADAFNYVMEEVREQKMTFDVIIVDFPDPESEGVAKLYSKEFYFQLSKILSSSGVISIQATSPYHASKTFACIGQSLQHAGLEVLPYHENVPSFGDWGWYLARPKTKIALAQSLFLIDTIPVTVQHLTAYQIRANMAFGLDQQKIINDASIKPNTLMNPVILDYYERDAWKVE